MRISRRALFFLAVALVFVLMVPPTPPEFRWLNLVMAGLALFWAALLAIEDLSNRRRDLGLPRYGGPSDLPSAD
jgi:ABC-type transport system involved in cytochrome c biogenesis permease component